MPVLMFVWFCVMTQAIFPGAERAFALQTAALDAHMRAQMEM